MKTGASSNRAASQTPSNKALSDKEGSNAPSVLAHRLALLVQESPDLASIINAWPTLPDAVKAGVMAMVEASA